MYDHADLTADRLVTYRQICKQVARELYIEASFMPAGHRDDGQRLPPQPASGDGVNVLADPGVTGTAP